MYINMYIEISSFHFVEIRFVVCFLFAIRPWHVNGNSSCMHLSRTVSFENNSYFLFYVVKDI